jgi:predicted AAA+ superfamily ATPase
MKRDLLSMLLQWKEDPLRMPLILRGARQVGKSWLVRELGKEFENFIELNFDEDENICSFFNNHLSLQDILERIQFYTGKKIKNGQTLLFFDEIQECPRAIKMLRYFKEKIPELHVIVAGSLLDFELDKSGLPVGRVQFLFLYPLSFGEFLNAMGRSDLREYIHSSIKDQSIHAILLELLKVYMWLGGLPAIVSAWIKYRDAEKCQSLQDSHLIAYQQDFHKYARKNQIPYVEKVFLSIPQQLGNKFKYKHVDHETKSTTIKNALELLIKAGIAYPCFHTPGQGIPLGANKDEKKYKIFFFDIGIAQRISGLKLREWVTMPIDVQHLGSIAEQLVAQEYAAYSSSTRPCELYYWQREEAGSNAEVDFLFVKDNAIIPVEVKSGIKGGMKSMITFLNSHPHSSYGLKISQKLSSDNGNIHEICLYALEYWLRQDKWDAPLPST